MSDPASPVHPPQEQPALPPLPLTFRPTRTRIVLISAGIVILGVIASLGWLLEVSPGERLSFLLTALLGFGVLLLLSRPKVTADRDGVTVVNLTTRRHLEWAEIVRVNLRPGDPWVFLDLADGTTLPVMGIQPGISQQQAIRDVRRLRALAEAHGTGRAPR